MFLLVSFILLYTNSNFLGSKLNLSSFEETFKGLWNFGPLSVNSNFNPKDSGITKISENKIAASTPKSFIGNNVTSEASFLFSLNH